MKNLVLPMRVTVVAGDRSGPFFHDFGIPFFFFKKYNLVEPTAVDAISIEIMESAELVQFQRQYAPESLMVLRNLKTAGIPTIAHVDDNVWDIPPGNPAHHVYQGPLLDRFLYILHEADAVTTSTIYLARHCEDYNNNVYIWRNLVDPSMVQFLPSGRDNPEEIRIGWTTTPHHYDDFPVAEEAIKIILSKYPKVKLIFIGWLPEFCANLHISRFEYYNFVDSDAFYASLANLDFDIGIAPLADNNFNKGKTARKAQEYAMLKIPMVLSQTTNYKEWTHGETCLKAQGNNTQGWIKTLSWMIEHPKDRIKMAERAHEQCMRNHNIDKFIWERAYVYYDVYRKIKGKPHPYTPIIEAGMKELGIFCKEEL